ncbi:hypothetical protein K3495_g11587 [Podosphaera aphanis]|nr:hypothetical protein K3495_g11587 [Podosphaera aphanis]
MRYLHNPSRIHTKAGKRILRYLAGTKYLAIKFEKGTDDHLKIYSYSDANFADFDTAGSKSHSGWLFFMSGGVISSSSKLQTTVSLSSTESELYGIGMAAREAACIRQLLDDINYMEPDGKIIKIFADNQGSIALTSNPTLHQRTKHIAVIAVKWWYIRQQVENQEVELHYCSTEQMAADGMTKPLGRIKHLKFVEQLRFKDIKSLI